MDKQMLMKVARLIFELCDEDLNFEVVERRHWPTASLAGEPLRGLCVGDVVYTFYQDDGEFRAMDVVFVSPRNGIAYVIEEFEWSSRPPRLVPVNAEDFRRTRREAVATWRDEMASELRICREQAARVQQLELLLGENE